MREDEAKALLDLIADYVEARAARRDYPDLYDPSHGSVDPDEIAARFAQAMP